MEQQFVKSLIGDEIYPCFSVIIPLKNSISERNWNQQMIEKIHKTVSMKIREEFEHDIAEQLENNITQLITQIKPKEKRKGIGLFFTPFSKRLIEFPFEVKEKIVVDDHFELKDIYYLSGISINYLLLDLNDKKISLFEGFENELREIIDQNFPIKITDDYEYARPSIATSFGYGLQNTEDDLDKIKYKRFTFFVKQSVKRLNLYMIKNQVLFISGNQKEISLIKHQTDFSNKISGELHGDFIHQTVLEKQILLETTIKKYINNEEKKLIERLDDAFGKNLAVCGIQDVWRTSKEGNGLILLVEKDFEITGYEVSSEPKLYLSPPDQEYDLVRDAVEDCISTVISKGGKVVVFENGKLNRFNKIGLILRYKN